MLDGLERELNREAVRYAVSRAIFCPSCDAILDMDDAVLVTGSGKAGISCGACWDRSLAAMEGVRHAAFLALVADGTLTVDDGRELRAMRLLTLGNPKVAKGIKRGYLPAILHLAPSTQVGTFQVKRADGTMRTVAPNLCPQATDGCAVACLFTAGRGGFDPAIPAARKRRTRWYFADRAGFMLALESDILELERKAAREGLIPVVRLNGTSDIKWESVSFTDASGARWTSIFARFAHLTFYDYTKLPTRKIADVPNYSLTFSLADGNERAAEVALSRGMNVAVVLRNPANPGSRKPLALPLLWKGRPILDGDETDLRFLDPPGGNYIALRAKGKAVHDRTGFVHDLEVAA